MVGFDGGRIDRKYINPPWATSKPFFLKYILKQPRKAESLMDEILRKGADARKYSISLGTLEYGGDLCKMEKIYNHLRDLQNRKVDDPKTFEKHFQIVNEKFQWFDKAEAGSFSNNDARTGFEYRDGDVLNKTSHPNILTYSPMIPWPPLRPLQKLWRAAWSRRRRRRLKQRSLRMRLKKQMQLIPAPPMVQQLHRSLRV